MNDFGRRPPLYLVIDVAESGQIQRKNKLVNEIVNGLRREAPPDDDYPVVLVTFAEDALLRQRGQVGYLSWIGGVLHRPGVDRSFARVFEMLGETLAEEHATAAGGSPEGTVVVFVTDGPDLSNWHPVFESFNRAVRPTMVTVAHGYAENGLSDYLEGNAGRGPKVSRRADVADVVVETVIRWVRDLQAYGRPSGHRASEYVETGFRYTGAEAGQAAGTLGRQGITTVPMHEGGPDRATRLPAAPAAIAVSDGPRMQTDAVTPTAAVPDAQLASAANGEARDGVSPRQPVTDATPTMMLPVRPQEPPHAAVDDDAHDRVPAEWKGALTLTPFVVGDPGRASEVRALPDTNEWNQRDTVLDGVTLLGVDEQPVAELRAASCRGLSHRHSGTVRQDDYGYRCTNDRRFLVCAVSDGVSSARLSHKAAALVTRQGCEILVNELQEHAPDEIDWGRVLNGVGAVILDFGARLLQKSRRPGEPEEVAPEEVARQMAATAVFAIVDLRPDADGLPVHVCTVGDSSAWVLRDGRTWHSLKGGKNDGGAISTSKTAALPMVSREPPQPSSTVLGRHDVLALITDGLGDPLGDADTPVGRFLTAKWSQPPPPLEFAAQVDFARRSHDDDRTALAVWPVRSR